MTASTLTQTDPAARQPLDASDLVRLMIGGPTAFAGSYPPDLARRPRVASAQSLRELDLNFTTAPKVLSRGARFQRAAWVRAGFILSSAAVFAIGVCVGAAGGWWRAQSALEASAGVMPRADWRIESIAPNTVTVRFGERLWPIHPGDRMPNGERLVKVNAQSLTIVTDTGVFKLVAPAPGAAGAP